MVVWFPPNLNHPFPRVRRTESHPHDLRKQAARSRLPCTSAASPGPGTLSQTYEFLFTAAGFRAHPYNIEPISEAPVG